MLSEYMIKVELISSMKNLVDNPEDLWLRGVVTVLFFALNSKTPNDEDIPNNIDKLLSMNFNNTLASEQSMNQWLNGVTSKSKRCLMNQYFQGQVWACAYVLGIDINQIDIETIEGLETLKNKIKL